METDVGRGEWNEEMGGEGEGRGGGREGGGGGFFFKQKAAYELSAWLEFRRVLFRSSVPFRFLGRSYDGTASVRLFGWGGGRS